MHAYMPNRSIEIHDSVLANVLFSSGQALLYFSAVYIHQSEGIPGCDPGSGWVQAAVLRVQDAMVEGSFSEFPVDLSDGQTQMGETIWQNEIPVPLSHKGAFELRLQAMWQGQTIVSFTGSGAELDLLGEPKYVEEFPPKRRHLSGLG